MTLLPAAPHPPQSSNNWLIGILAGMCTATFGGIGRDLLCQARTAPLLALAPRLAWPGLALPPATC